MQVEPQDSGRFHIMGEIMMRTLARLAAPELADLSRNIWYT
jgi:hypothetical protein